MRIRLEITAAASGWVVGAFDDTGAGVRDAIGQLFLRELGVASGGDAPFPLPPHAEVMALSEAERALCDASIGGELQDVLDRIVRRAPRNEDVERFGRYLFNVLIGDALWKVIARPGQWLDLVIAMPGAVDAVRPLTRLPWELMHGPAPSGPLAGLPGVSLTREIATACASLSEATRPPCVLFVVGTELHRDVIRPGAEYLQLVRGLRASQLTLKTHLLCRATHERVKEAVARLQPDVVHFICHGGIDPATYEPYLELVDETNTARPQKANGQALLQMLRGQGESLPRLVVLSACYAATAVVTPVGQVGTPLAQRLVEGGVPLVVAMAGPIADATCRLFTRQFYEAVITQEDIARATAIGRRAAVAGGANLNTHADWALPTFFAAQGLVDPRLRVAQTQEQLDLEARWRSIFATAYFGVRPIFCDRLEVFEKFDALLAERPLQAKYTRDARTFNVMAIEVPEADTELKVSEPAAAATYGRTWLLKELASKATADGHLAVVVSTARDHEPKTYGALLKAIQDATLPLLVTLGLEHLGFDRLVELQALAATGPPPAWLPKAVHQGGRDAALAWALRDDFVRILDEVRQTFRSSGERCCLVLMVDDVHRMGEAAGDLFDKILGQYGLAREQDIKVVVATASKAAPGQEPAVEAVKRWLNERLPIYAKATIWRFGRADRPLDASASGMQRPLEEQLAYEYFLLKQPFQSRSSLLRGLALKRGIDEGNVKLFWAVIAGDVKGVPSRLGPGLLKMLQSLDDDDTLSHFLVEANDDDWLERANQEAP